MRLHLIISRHGLPATRILWTTTSATSALGEYGTQRAAPASAVASSQAPNIAFANGGYTVAQLLEDVNEVVPLETEPSVFDPHFSGQWGLEDYVVEVGGSECLHFMEIDGLLRDGDEVVIRALQLADLRARRLCGRHQITADGKHLIDGVPFGLPFLQRNNSTRPAITIPPRKKRRTVFSGWEPEEGYGDENANADEEGDGEWLPPSDTGFGKELSVLPVDQEPSDMGTVIRHPVDYDMESESEGDESSPEENELESELKALKEDFDEPASQFIDIRNQAQAANRPSLRSASMAKRPSSSDTLRRGLLVRTSSLSSKHSRGEDSSPRASKAVRFNKGDRDVPRPSQAEASAGTSESEEAASSSESSDASSSDEEEDDDSDSSDDDNDEDGADSDSAESSDSSSEDSSSESEEEEEASPPAKKPRVSSMNPPGQGSLRTKKSNHRFKLRRRLSKLKEVGRLPPDADFAALNQLQENEGFHIPEEPSVISTPVNVTDPREQEQLDFEARRQKLLEAIASGGVDVEETSEKENVPPRLSAPAETTVSAEAPAPEEASEAVKAEAEISNRRTLDIASSRRLLFGSLGMRTPKTKEEEEAARKKLAAKASTVPTPRKAVETQEVEQEEDEANVNWQDKLEIKATECYMDDIELSAPPFPFVQRWDEDAHAIIAERKGWNNKKRKRKERIQVYNGDGYEDDYQDGNEDYDGDVQLNYDDEWPTAEDEAPAAENLEDAPEPVDDLPGLPNDLGPISDLLECEAKVGAIIAFRQLDMSKATNWQPRMSEYRVAEVHNVLDNGSINVRLAIRDRTPKQQPEDPEDDRPRRYSGFEMPGFDDAEEEDDGYRELAFAELCEPKLLRPAPSVMDDTTDKDQDNAQEDSLSVVSVIQDSMANAQPEPAPAPVDMDLDETTFVTLVTAASRNQSPNGTPRRGSDAGSIQTPGGVRLPQGQDADDENSDTPAVLSPSFSGFHSARSSPGTRPGTRSNGEVEETNLDGHTLIGEPQSTLVDTSNQDMSALSFLSALQSTSEHASESLQQDRQVVDEPSLGSNADNGSRAESLQSVIHRPDGRGSAKSSRPQSVVAESQAAHVDGPSAAPKAWDDLMPMFKSGETSQDNTDQDNDEAGPGANHVDDYQDSLLHSDQDFRLSPDPSPPRSSSSKRLSDKLKAASQGSDPSWLNFDSDIPSAQPKSYAFPSQTSVVIDLTDSPGPSVQTSQDQPEQASPSNAPSQGTRSSSGKASRTADKGSPQTQKKQKRPWRRF